MTAAERLDRWLSDDTADPTQVSEAAHALDDQELLAFGLRAYRMNLLALLGERLPPPTVRRAARAAAISKILGGWEYHHHYLPRLGVESHAARIQGMPLAWIRELLAEGRGLVIASFHLGHMRDVPSDLAHAGIPVRLPLARDSYNDYATARDANPDAALWKRFDFFGVEERSGSVGLARWLRAGGCVFATVDGNTGTDGPRGDERRSRVALLDCEVKVKNGLFAMAARFGAPVLPMIACDVDGVPTCLTAPLLDPGGPLEGDAAVAFVESTARAVYAAFGHWLVDHADQWCGGDLFHQWRIPADAGAAISTDVEGELRRSLDGGARLVMNARRIVELGQGDEHLWTDAHSLRCYRLPGEARALAERLEGAQGVDQAWIASLPAPHRERLWPLLCQLAARGAVTTRDEDEGLAA